jgi:hypothetical protein
MQKETRRHSPFRLPAIVCAGAARAPASPGQARTHTPLTRTPQPRRLGRVLGAGPIAPAYASDSGSAARGSVDAWASSRASARGASWRTTASTRSEQRARGRAVRRPECRVKGQSARRCCVFTGWDGLPEHSARWRIPRTPPRVVSSPVPPTTGLGGPQGTSPQGVSRETDEGEARRARRGDSCAGAIAPAPAMAGASGGKPTVEREVINETFFDDFILDICGVATNTT